MADEKDTPEGAEQEKVTVTLKHSLSLGGGHGFSDPHIYGPGTVQMPRATADALGLEYEEGEPKTTGEAKDYKSMKKDELEALAEERGLEIEGSGADGAILKDDLIAALEADDEEQGGGEE